MKARKVVGPSAPAAEDATQPAEYLDFLIVAERIDDDRITIGVDASPAGRSDHPHVVAFSAQEASDLRTSFLASFTGQRITGGRGTLTLEEASEIGARLGAVLFAGEAFRLFAESLRTVVARGGRLRIRLAMDESLLDLPWEYARRPDRLDHPGLSSFLLIDPTLSMVRHAPDERIQLLPVTGSQRLTFVGTYWAGDLDGWEVWTEFARLRVALKPVAPYIKPEFSKAADPAALDDEFPSGTAIFHYAGHCDFDEAGQAYLIKQLPTSRAIDGSDVVYVDDVATGLAASGVRLVVLSACNSGYWAVVKPLIEAGIPAVIGVNGGVLSVSTIEFCTHLYESLALGLTLDEAVGRARLHVLEWGREEGLFDWGLYMVHMPSPQAALFPRKATRSLATRQQAVRTAHAQTVGSTLQFAREIDGMHFGEIMSELSERRVLILGRFTGRRLKVLKAIETHLRAHANGYKPELFTYHKPDSRDLVESIVGFAALSRFVIADLSEPKSVQSELEAIVPHFQSVPVVPLISRTGKEYATFGAVQRRPNVVKPTVRYRDLDDLIKKLDAEVVPLAETKLAEVRPGSATQT